MTRFLLFLSLMLTAGLWAAGPAVAQGLFAPRVIINEKVVTNYEVDQRFRMLTLFGAAGDLREQALQGLIDDRLREGAAATLGLTASDEDIRAGMEEFASRANLTGEQFIIALGSGGVAAETFRDFVRAGLLWREVVRARFLPRAQITETEIDRALAQAVGSGTAVVEYAMFLLPEGPTAPAEAERVRGRVDTCDDLYAVAKGLPPERLIRESRTTGELPQDIGRELARLDAGEISTALVRGGARVVLMLCGRTPQMVEAPNREAIREALRNQRLAAYADGYLEELRADAIIRTP
ncbi:MAG: hypothetical protein ACK4L4_04495 [Gemmobacter sp.]